MTGSRMQDRVDSNEQSKGTRKIISKGRKQFKVENKCGTKRVNFQNPYECRFVKYFCCMSITIKKNILYIVHFYISWLSAHTLNEFYFMPISHTRA